MIARGRPSLPGLILAFLAVLSIASTTICTASPAPSAKPPIAVTLDETQLGPIGVDRAPEQPLVALEPLAEALGWHVVRVQNGARIENEDRSLTLAIGSRYVREDGDPRTLLSESPADRGGKLYLPAADLARIFGLTLSRPNGALAFARPVELESDVSIEEVARPATPHPLATPRPLRQQAGEEAAGNANAGRVLISLDRFGSNRIVSITGQTQSPYLHTWLSSTGMNELFGAPVATVNVGSAQRNVTLGMYPDPIGGLIFRGGAYEGVDLYRGDERVDQFFGRRLDAGYSSVGEVYNVPDGGGADTYALLTKADGDDQAIFRRFRSYIEPWGRFSREYIAGDRGAGIGFSARTKGDTFLESTVTYATKGLPLGPNDAPISVDLGRNVSRATTVVAGFEATPRQPWGPFAGISTHGGNLSASLTASAHDISAGLGYQSQQAQLQFYAVPGIQHATGLNGNMYLPGATLEAQSSNSVGNSDSTLLLRTIRPGLNFIGGIGLPNGGRPGPIAGLSIPLGKLFALDTTLQPAISGPYNLHVALAVGIPSRRPRGAPTVPATVRLAGSGPFPAMRLFVDGAPIGKFSGAQTTVRVERGMHTFAVESLDGALGAQDTPVRIEAAGDTVSLAVWPERTVTGRVRLAPGVQAPGEFCLGNLIVLIEPGDLTAETNADGSFVFPKQPIAPDATIKVDPGSLPRQFQGPAAIPLGAGEIELLLQPGVHVERRVFPSQ